MKSNNIAFSVLRAEMSRNRLTITDLANGIGCTRDTMSNWLSKKTSISLDVAIKLQNLFFDNFTVWELFSELWNDNKSA